MKTLSMTLTTLFFLSLPARADTVIYFGGYLSSAAQVGQWAQGAKSAQGGHDYLALPWPAGVKNAGGDDVIYTGAGKATIQQALQKIRATTSGKIILVGHSSGAALSNETARQALGITSGKKKKGASPQAPDSDLAQRLRVVSLDGFAPRNLHKKVATLCVSAYSQYGKARNYSSMQGCPRTFFYQDNRGANSCRTPWCNHFLLVSKSPHPQLTGSSKSKKNRAAIKAGGPKWWQVGYDGASTNANLDWMGAVP